MEEGYLLHNPAWKMYKPQGEKKERPVADEELVQRLIAALEGQSLKYETYFKLVLATGCAAAKPAGCAGVTSTGRKGQYISSAMW